MLASPAADGFMAAQGAYAADSTVAEHSTYKKMLIVQEDIAQSGFTSVGRTYSAGIAAVQDSSDFLLDCGGRAGYDYLGTMPKGRQMQQLYNDMLDAATELWNDTTSYLEDIEDYVCYGQLSSNGLSFNEMSIVYYTFRNDNPVFYFVGGTSASYWSEFLMLTDPAYQSGSARRSAQKSIIDYVTSTAEKAEGAETDYEKALIVHDAINEDVEYAYDAFGRPSLEDWAHNILGAAEKGSGVCETYARTFQAVMNYLDVDNYLITGRVQGGDHAWNMVRLDDGNYYYVDCTWDDDTGGYYYFAKGSLTMDRDHFPDKPGDDPMYFLIEIPKAPQEDFDPDNYTPAPKFPPYDVNGDGNVNVTDVSLVAAHVKAIRSLSGDSLLRADVNGDGNVNITDLSKIAAIVKGIGR